MPADGRHPRLPWLLCAALLAAAGPAGAQVFGTVQFQYQNAEDVRLVVLPDGTRVLRRSATEQLLKSFDVRQQSYLRQNLLMDTNLRFTELSQPGASDLTRTPSGTVRLLHPAFQLSAQHQPTTVRTTGSGALAGSVSDTSRTVRSTRTSETSLIGNAVAPGGVHFNASWIGRRREATAISSTEQTSLRSARAALDREHVSLYALASDQQQKTAGGEVRGRQRQLGAGGLWKLAPAPATAVMLQYDASSSRSQPNAGFTSTTNSQSATATGDWRPGGAFGAYASYNWRRTSTRSARNSTYSDQDGSLLGRWTPVRGATLTSGGGFRTQRGIDGSPRLLEYVTAVAAGEGRVRPGWTANASASHTTTWDPDRGVYGVQTAAGISRMQFGPRASLDATLSIAANDDSAAASQRWSNAWTSRLHTQPLRSLTLSAGVRGQRVGPGLLRPVSMSRGLTLDVLWRPHPRADLIGNYAINEQQSAPRQRTRTWSSSARAQLAERWQLQASWTRTATPLLARGVESIVTRDLASGRLLWQPTRRVAASVSLSTTDPGKELEARRIDGTFTWSFGR